MKSLKFQNAYYIKLGRKGAWETDSIRTGKLRLGWRHQTVEDINNGNWHLIEKQLREEHRGKPAGVATTDLNALKNIATSDREDVWIAFHHGKLWWTRLAGSIEEDQTSKYRATSHPWSDKSLNGRLLVANELPGKISQLQGFRGTSCRVKYSELLQRTLNGVRSEQAAAISDHLASLAQLLSDVIKELHWKDFETLVDLVFRDAGLVRISVLGQHAKAYDLELREPITDDRFIVQVKSRANLADLESTISNFSPDDYRKIFFVVHSPAINLVNVTDLPDYIEIVSPERLGELALDAGLARWIENKVA